MYEELRCQHHEKCKCEKNKNKNHLFFFEAINQIRCWKKSCDTRKLVSEKPKR